ncbi:MAG: TetR/AcrR family transcriptional regulator [Microbacteriaceae bacterium]|nr:TetR/AcrR family transcriptional regulator [Microbacteriaceae bacterium]
MTSFELTPSKSANCLALILSAQRILATIGPNATVEQIAKHADVSPATVDNYFGNKESLLMTGLDQALREWVDWAYGDTSKGESLEALIDVCRKLFRVGQTHPEFSQILANALRDPDFVIEAVLDAALPALEHVAHRGQLPIDDFEQRTALWANAVAAIVRDVHTTRKLSPTAADASLAKALAIWDVSPKTAKDITSRRL